MIHISKLKNKLTLFLMSALIFGGTFIFPIAPAHAGAWGEAIAAAIMKQTMENISRTIEGALLGTLKVAAVQLLNTQVLQFVGGSQGSQPKIITDFRDLITRIPEQKAEQVVLGDLLTQTLRGKGSQANYKGVNELGGINGSYESYLEGKVRDVVANKNTLPKSNFSECNNGSGDARTALSNGEAKAISCLLQNQSNNPFGISLLAEETYNKEYEKALEEQKLKATSSGFLPATDKNGKITTPAATIENLVSDVSTLGNKIIAGASNPGEFLSGVVVSVVNRTVSNLVQKGVGDIQSKISREISNVDGKVSGAINKAQSVVGPAAAFTDELNQRTKTPNTTAPPINRTPCFSGSTGC